MHLSCQTIVYYSIPHDNDKELLTKITITKELLQQQKLDNESKYCSKSHSQETDKSRV